MTTLGQSRLLTLAAFLEQLPPGAINMHSWLSDRNGDFEIDRQDIKDLSGKYPDGIKFKPTSVAKIRECGFAACALGWACTIPEFHEAGLALVDTSSPHRSFIPRPMYRGHQDYRAAVEFFDIDAITANRLFNSEAYDEAFPLPSIVAARIRSVVDDARTEGDTV